MQAVKLHHPVALYFLFLTEMWERFGFYVVQGLLVLYMTDYFGFSDSASYTILGVFTALVYISPLAGGFLANRILGFKTSVLWGGAFLVLGYALLALPYAKLLLYPALATIIVGNGLLKPNISSLLGAQYDFDDPRRESGFTIFYIGINIGAFLAGLSAGYIKEFFGWRISFALASLGLIIGFITFAMGLHTIKAPKTEYKSSTAFKFILLLGCFITIGILSCLLNISKLADWLLPCVGIILFIGLIMLTLKQKAEHRQRLFVLNILIISSIVFWMLGLQIFYSGNLFVERLVDKNIFGIPLTTTLFWGSEAIFIILLGPFFAWLWEILSRNAKNPSPVIKFSLGILFAGMGFLILGISTYFPNSEGLINASWVFSAYLFITIGELLLSPIGLSAVTMLSPPSLIGLMMGAWFVATGFGGIFAGMTAKIASVPSSIQLNTAKLAIYQTAFFDYAYCAFFVAVVLFLVHLKLRKSMAHKLS